MALATQERERERRGGALPPVLLRSAGVSPGFGAGGAEVGLGQLFAGVGGRGGFLGLMRAVFGSAFTPAQLAVLGIGFGGTLLMGLVIAYAQLGAASGDAPTAVAWATPPPEDGAGAALTRPTDGPRPTPEDLLMARGGMAEAAPRETDSPKSEPARPQKDVAPSGAQAVPAGPVEDPAPAGAPPRLFSDDFGFKGAGGSSSGGSLRDGLNAVVPSAAAVEAALRPAGGEMGSLSASSRAMARARLAPLAGRLSRASRAAGQLRFAQRASTLGLSSGGVEGARQYSTDAFEQKSTIAGPSTGGVGMTGGELTGPLGVGAPDLTQPAVGPVENQTPYQDKADDAKKGIDMAVLLMALGAGLLAGGLAMLAMGKQMMAAPDPTGATKAQGSALMKLGAVMMMAGIAALAAGAMMAQDSKKKGKEIGQESGQKEQGRVVESCANDAAVGNRCSPKPIAIPQTTVQEDVAAERKALTGAG